MLYLITIVVGMFDEAFVKRRIVVPGNATATAANLRSMESLWRVGIAGEMIMCICAIALTLILYLLLRPVSRDLALLATFFSQGWWRVLDDCGAYGGSIVRRIAERRGD